MQSVVKHPGRRSSADILHSLNSLTDGDNIPRRRHRKSSSCMNQANVSVQDRQVVAEALERSRETNGPAAAMELDDGRIITGKTTNLLGASAALLLNVFKGTGGN